MTNIVTLSGDRSGDAGAVTSPNGLRHSNIPLAPPLSSFNILRFYQLLKPLNFMTCGTINVKPIKSPGQTKLKRRWSGLDQEKKKDQHSCFDATLTVGRLSEEVWHNFFSVLTMWRSTGQHWWQEIWLSRNRKAAIKRLGRTLIPSDHKEVSYLHRYTTRSRYNSYQLISEAASVPWLHTSSYYFRKKCESHTSDNVCDTCQSCSTRWSWSFSVQI